ncbi:alpha-L-fucosidase [Isoptericola halotolerans]|uniref:OmpL47-type beta-barrel domain-containing protein n=1 Tax=Isoptericola halotolerans TaxID=300560 RepID=UPI00388E3234
MTRTRPIRAVASLASATLIATTLTVAVPGAAAATVPQAGDTPVEIDQTDEPDNLVMLTAGSAERSDTMPVVSSPRPKYGYVTGFETADDYLRWEVRTPAAAEFATTLQMNPGAPDQSFVVEVDGEDFPVTVDDDGWQRVDAGSIRLPAGSSTITMRRDSLSGTAEVKSLELMRSDLVAGYEQRVADYREAGAATATDLSEDGYGIMFQYGPWGYPVSGDTAKSIDDQAADFDVPAFVDMIESTGAQYVIWSATWWTYEMNAPISAVDDAVGHGGRTSERDLIGDVAAALDEVGIDFHLYYHTGQDSHLGWGSTDWWQAQDWPGSFSDTGLGARETFFDHWKAVVGEMGERYGDLLKGWFFDDGRAYYPGRMEELAEAARAGNPERVISYNNANASLVTEFQDVSFGEHCRADDAEIGGDGSYVRGAEVGQQGHCMYKLDSAWGVSAPDQTTAQRFSAQGAYDLIRANSARGVATSLDIMMWEDGTIDPDTLDVLHELKDLRDDGTTDLCGPDCTRLNNTDPSITYTGDWEVSSGRGNGDYLDDLSYTDDADDSFSFTFTGTGVTLYMPRAGNYSSFDVTVDGVEQGTYDADADSYLAQQATYSIDGLAHGEHTVTATRAGAQWFQLDYIEYRTSCVGCTTVNNSDPSISYTGDWEVSDGRTLGDFEGDLAYSETVGDSFSYTFTGTGVTVYMPRYVNYGDFAVELDGEDQGVHDAVGDTYTPQSPTYSVEGLGHGEHTLTVTMLDGRWFQLDYLAYRGCDGCATDTTAPVVETVVGSDGTRTEGWWTDAVTVTVSAVDGGPGDVTLEHRRADEPWSEYTGPLTVEADGEHQIEIRATDAAGNVSDVERVAVAKDATAPETTASVEAVSDGREVTLTAVDAHSGVATTEYAVDGGDWTAYDGPVLVSGGGAHDVQFRSADVAGNTEVTRSIGLEPTAPEGTYGDGWYKETRSHQGVKVSVRVQCSGHDTAAIGFYVTTGQDPGSPYTATIEENRKYPGGRTAPIVPDEPQYLWLDSQRTNRPAGEVTVHLEQGAEGDPAQDATLVFDRPRVMCHQGGVVAP